MSGKLTKDQKAILKVLPHWIGVGIPARTVSELLGDPSAEKVSRHLRSFLSKGLVEREQPNEEWPYCYASTDLGRAALTSEQDSQENGR